MEEGEILTSDSEHNALDKEEAKIDLLKVELTAKAREIEEKRLRIMNSSKQPQKNRRKNRKKSQVQQGAVGETEYNDNYDVVNMDIESPDNGDKDDEAENLRRLLLEQMKKKKSSQPGSTKVPPPRILAPPLFPPGFNFLPPPPAPPQIEYEEYESIMCENSAVLELVDEVTDTPRSPDVVPGTFNFAISSSDASDDDLDYELDLDEAKHEQQQRTRELSRLFKQQKKNKSEYEASKKAVERKREELRDLEQKIMYHSEKGFEINEKIKEVMDRSFTTQLKRLEMVNEERNQWKQKVGQRSARSKEKIHRLKEVVISGQKQPKIIPLNPVNTPLNSRISAEPVVSTPSRNEPVAKKSRDTKGSKAVKRVKCVDKSTPQLNIAQITGDGKSNSTELETELFNRLMAKKKKTPDKQVQVDEIIDDPIQHASHILPPTAELMTNANFPKCSRFVSVAEAARNPLINFRSYRISPSFPFEYIAHPSISGQVRSDVQLCPYELHGICADPTCKWQHDQDSRAYEEEIIRDIIDLYPPLCPSHLTPVEYSRRLLEKNDITTIARSLASAIPEDVRDKCFSDELKRFLQ